MSNNVLRFVALQTDAYAGINKNSQVEVETVSNYLSDEVKKMNPDGTMLVVVPLDARYIGIEGNSGVGKTSFVNRLIESFGGKPPVNAINTETKTKRYVDRFWGLDNHFYEVVATTTETKLFRIDTDENGKPLYKEGTEEYIRSEVGGAKGMLLKLIGPTGTSPLILASRSGAQQIEWMRKLYKPNDESLKEENELIKHHKAAFEERTAIGRDVTRINGKLASSDYYTNALTWQAFFDENAEKYKDVPRQMVEVQKNYEEYQEREKSIAHYETELNANVSNMERNELDIARWMKEIAELQKKIETGQAAAIQYASDIQQIQEAKQNVDEWMTEHESYKTEYDNISNLSREATDFELKKKDFQNVLADEKELQTLEHKRMALTKKIDSLALQKRAMVKQYTPDVPGLEVCVPDAEETREGIYYNGLPLTHLNESSQWDWFLPLCPQVGINVIVIDNINTLGSGTIERLNRLLEENPSAYVFATQMNRKEQKMKVYFKNKIPE